MWGGRVAKPALEPPLYVAALRSGSESVEKQGCSSEGGGVGGGISSQGGRMGFLIGNQGVVLSTNEFEKGLGVSTLMTMNSERRLQLYRPFCLNYQSTLLFAGLPQVMRQKCVS